MPAVKSSAAIAKKWADVTPLRSGDYEQGVKSPRRSWEQATSEAAGNYEQGVTAAIQGGRFASGVARAGDEKWRRGAVEKGARRWGPGVQAGQADYAQGFEPYRQVIEGTNLPPRFAKGDPRNLERVRAMSQALHEAKVRQS